MLYGTFVTFWSFASNADPENVSNLSQLDGLPVWYLASVYGNEAAAQLPLEKRAQLDRSGDCDQRSSSGNSQPFAGAWGRHRRKAN